MASHISHVTRQECVGGSGHLWCLLTDLRLFGQDSVKPTWPHFLLDLSAKALANLHVAHSSWDHTLSLPR